MKTADQARDVEALAYVLDALRRQEVRHRQSHWSVPAGVVDLIAEIGFEVSRGQDGSALDAPGQDEQVGVIEPKAVRYETAAQLLEVSVSTIKRLVKDGRLCAVSLGGSRRIPVTSIDAMLAHEGGEGR